MPNQSSATIMQQLLSHPFVSNYQSLFPPTVTRYTAKRWGNTLEGPRFLLDPALVHHLVHTAPRTWYRKEIIVRLAASKYVPKTFVQIFLPHMHVRYAFTFSLGRVPGFLFWT